MLRNRLHVVLAGIQMVEGPTEECWSGVGPRAKSSRKAQNERFRRVLGLPGVGSTGVGRVWKCGKTSILAKNGSHARLKRPSGNPGFPGSPLRTLIQRISDGRRNRVVECCSKTRVLLQNPIGCCATQPSHACRPMGGGGFGEVVGV